MTINPKDNSFLVTVKLDGTTVMSHHMHLSKAMTETLEAMWMNPQGHGLLPSDTIQVKDTKGETHAFQVGRILVIHKRPFDPFKVKR